MTDKQQPPAAPERTIDRLTRETSTPVWALEIAFELSTLGMLDEETMAGNGVIPDAARVIADLYARVHPVDDARVAGIRKRADRLRVQNKADLLLAASDVERAYENTIYDLLDDVDYLLSRLSATEDMKK
jgi:hypothetical protein